jgi:hypothetical protein
VVLGLLVGGYLGWLLPLYFRHTGYDWDAVGLDGRRDGIDLFGFWPMVAIAVLCLGTVVLLGLRADPADRVAVRICGGVLCLLSLGAAFGAVLRLFPYVARYGFTPLRVLALVGLVLLVVVALVVAVAGRLPRSVVWLVPVTVLALAVADPEPFMVWWMGNGWYWGYTNFDERFVSGLSADAVPEMVRLPDPLVRDCVVVDWRQRHSTVDSWYAFNLGRRTGRALAARHTVKTYLFVPCFAVDPPRAQELD